MSIFSQLTQRERRLLSITVLILGSVGLYIYVIEPLWQFWVNRSVTIVNLKKQLNRDEIILSREDTIVNEYLFYEKKLKFHGSDQEKTAQILKEIETSARNNGVNINDMKPQQILDEDFYKFYRIELEGEADIMALSRFIYDLQISQQALRVTRLQITASSAKPHLLKIDIIITKIILQ
ncbi:MAG: type II secretion system protein GspM [Candidatus Auribacterota bacterium]|jgi:hypothetical protein|nr:type II secretion system protein GspM [Candidatus Auribacterota bacterium]